MKELECINSRIWFLQRTNGHKVKRKIQCSTMAHNKCLSLQEIVTHKTCKKRDIFMCRTSNKNGVARLAHGN